jgi:very-short-patch-repair endonuclease
MSHPLLYKAVCKVCNKEFPVNKYRIDKAKCCSRACLGKFHIGAKRSLETRMKIADKARGKKHPWQTAQRVESVCLECSKISIVPKSIAKTKKFCSCLCRAAWMKKNLSGFNSPINKRVIKNCEHCGSEFVARGHRLKIGQSKFCSMRCWGIWSRVHMPKKNTNIERMLEAELLKIGVPFESQKAIGNIAVVDFLVSKKLVVQADGDYWHKMPHMAEKDKRQDAQLKDYGFSVLRFWGSDIKKDATVCGNRIKDFLLNNIN